MTKARIPDGFPGPVAETANPKLSLEKAEKGSHRSMWELLLQLRVLLPYLARLVPLLDRGLLKAELESGNRDLETLTRNHTILLERIEEQITRLRGQHEDSTEESRRFFTDMRSFRRWMITMTIVIVVLLGATVGMLAFLIIHP